MPSVNIVRTGSSSQLNSLLTQASASATYATKAELSNTNSGLSQVMNSFYSFAANPTSFRNVLINGDFNVWQRGTTFNTNNSYTADRWYVYLKSATFGTRETSDLPPGFKYGFKFYNTNSTNGPGITQFIETDSVIPLRNKVVTFSFWTKVTDFNDVLTPSIYYSTGGDTVSSYGLYGLEITNLSTSNFGAPGTWTRVSTSFTVPGNALGLSVGIKADSTQGASSIIRITGAQLEIGSFASTFENRPIGLEISLCQRYFQKSFPITTTPSAPAGTGDGTANNLIVYNATVGNAYSSLIRFQTTMRRQPDIVLYNAETSAIGTWSVYNSTGQANNSYAPGVSPFHNGMMVFIPGVPSITVSNGAWTANAEL